MLAKAAPVTSATVTVQNTVTAPPLAERSKLGADLVAGKFIALVEIVPPRGISPHRELQAATLLAQNGVEAINVPDSPRASARMSALSLCLQIQQQVGIETVLHYTCRDRNVLSIQSDLLGAASLGLRNILCLTGDPPKLGNYPDATAVFDVDAIGLVNIVRNLNNGLDIGGNSIGASTGFAIGVAANPGVPDLDNEVRRFAYKVEAGAEYAITQPVFDLRLLEAFLKRVEQFHLPVIAGIWPLVSLRNAEFMRNDLRVFVPDEILLRMQQADTPELARAEGVKIAQEMLIAARDMVQGVQVSAPSGRFEAALTVMESVLPNKSGKNVEPTAAVSTAKCDRKRNRESILASFEESLKQLETIIAKLERGDLPLEESVRLFEEGVKLSNACKGDLEAAEGKIQILLKQKDGSRKAETFPAADDSAGELK